MGIGIDLSGESIAAARAAACERGLEGQVELRQSEAALRSCGANILGIVLNAVEKRRSASRYYERYHYYKDKTA